MKKIRVKDKEFSIFISGKEIDEAISRIASKLNTSMHDRDPVFLVILNGAFMFASDLFRRLDFPCEISFIKLASYAGTRSTSMVRELIGLNTDLNGRTVIIVEDIIDTGQTISYMIPMLKKLGAREVRVVTLLFKPDTFSADFEIDHIGMKIPKEFIVGYGLDYDQHGRNYPDIYKIIE